MAERSRFLLVAPEEHAERSIGGSLRWTQGGDRYRTMAEAALAPHGEIDRINWRLDESLESFVDALDAGLAHADAMVAVPWFMFEDLVMFDAERLDRAPRLRAMAGTSDFRLGWGDLGARAPRRVGGTSHT